jgi:hypothetical protein
MMLTNLQHTAVCNMDYHEAEMRAQAQADNALELALAQLVAGSQPPDKFKVIVGKTNSGIAAVRRLSDETWEIAVVGKANIWEGSCPPLAPPTVCVRLNVRVRATYLKSERRLAILEYQRTSSRFEEPPEFTLASP